MLNMTLRLVRRDDNSLVLRLPHPFRAILGFAVVALLLGMIGREGFAVGPFLVILILALLATYRERWTFSRGESVGYQVGFLFAYRRESYPMDEVEALSVDTFTKGKMAEDATSEVEQKENGGEARPRLSPFKRRYVRLALVLTGGEQLDIETQPVRGGRNLGDRAEELSRFLGKPLRRE